MIKNLKRLFLKFLYKLLIFKVIIVDRNSFTHYAKLNTFCEIELESNMGQIRFLFKEDRRKRKRNLDKIFMINNFLVELKVPENIVLKRQEINEKVIIVIKFILFKVNYEVLSEVLLDIYVTNILKYIEKNIEVCEVENSTIQK